MNRHLMLNSWIWSVFEENKDMTVEKLLEEFKKDVPKSMASSLKKELEILKSDAYKIWKKEKVAAK